ncbi:hypothetical protein FB451DRAFT_1292729, partial [Mycena latifolia]
MLSEVILLEVSSFSSCATRTTALHGEAGEGGKREEGTEGVKYSRSRGKICCMPSQSRRGLSQENSRALAFGNLDMNASVWISSIQDRFTAKCRMLGRGGMWGPASNLHPSTSSRSSAGKRLSMGSTVSLKSTSSANSLWRPVKRGRCSTNAASSVSENVTPAGARRRIGCQEVMLHERTSGAMLSQEKKASRS